MKTYTKTPLAPLDAAAQQWVDSKLKCLSTEQKIAQIFVSMSLRDDMSTMRELMQRQPGGMLRYMGPDLESAWRATRLAVESSEIPLLISGDLEGGAYGQPYFSPVLNPLGIAACNDLDLSARIAQVLAVEGRAMGYNWSYTPVVDINAKFRSAIVGTRSFGSDVPTIIAQATAHIATLQQHGIAATAKHWPGEGFDDRDQHLVTTVNPLPWDEWQATYGQIYTSMIAAGVMSVMSAHIALPAWVRKQFPDAGAAAFEPASVSRLLNTELLRKHLGFEGLIVSDATPMAGFSSWGDRERMVPQVIESGCDMFLFGMPEQRDLELLLRGVRSGSLSEARLEAACTQVLSLKARLGLHLKTADELLPPLEQVRDTLRQASHTTITSLAASKTVTLVKDVAAYLPLSPQQHRRVVVITEGVKALLPGGAPRTLDVLTQGLANRGFEVRAFDSTTPPTPQDCDLVLYLFAQESMFSLSHIHANWAALHGGLFQCMWRFWHNIPTVMVSLGQPYYLYDAPRVPCYINAYTALPEVQEALLACLLGDQAFDGVSPVDAFCGLEDAQY